MLDEKLENTKIAQVLPAIQSQHAIYELLKGTSRMKKVNKIYPYVFLLLVSLVEFSCYGQQHYSGPQGYNLTTPIKISCRCINRNMGYCLL